MAAQEPTTSRTIPARVLPSARHGESGVAEAFPTGAEGPAPAIPKTAEDWKALATPPPLLYLKCWLDSSNKFGITVVPEMLGGVQCYVITPKVVNPRNRNRLLPGLHGGGFVMCWRRREWRSLNR